MKRNTQPASWLPLGAAAIFAAGVSAGWWAHVQVDAPRQTTSEQPAGKASPAPSKEQERVAATSGVARASTATVVSDVVTILRSRRLQLPINGAKVETMRGQFGDPRGGGVRGHEAVDLMAPRNTPIRAVDEGTIAKLFQSRAGGTTIYQFDPSERFCYYYAHLQAYAPGLHEVQHVARGEVIGFVGTSGNAPPNAPHLHFAIFQLNATRHWWEGVPIDPYQVFGGNE